MSPPDASTPHNVLGEAENNAPLLADRGVIEQVAAPNSKHEALVDKLQKALSNAPIPPSEAVSIVEVGKGRRPTASDRRPHGMRKKVHRLSLLN